MLDLAQDGHRRGRPDERARVLVVFPHIRANRGDEGGNAAEGAAPDPFACDLGEEALDEVQPRGPRGGEVEPSSCVAYALPPTFLSGLLQNLNDKGIPPEKVYHRICPSEF